jgi:hypothetical protein
LGREATPLPADIQNIKPRDHKRETQQHGVWEGLTPALQPAVWCPPDEKEPTIENVMDILQQLHDIHHYAFDI